MSRVPFSWIVYFPDRNCHVKRIIVLCLLFTDAPAFATVFPIDPFLIDIHFSNDVLAVRLDRELDCAAENMAANHRILQKMKGYTAPPAFTAAKYKKTYTVAEIEEWQNTGWIKTNEFGWSILQDQICSVLANWIQTFSISIRETQLKYPDGNTPIEETTRLRDTEERINDTISLHRHYLQRLKNWDEWCRKGPWLLEDASPRQLQQEIELLRAYLETSSPDPSILQDLYHVIPSDHETISACLKAKQTVYDWYYDGKLQKKAGMSVTLTSEGYHCVVLMELFGEGARQSVADIIRNGIEKYWSGYVQGIPFRMSVEVRISEAIRSEDTERIRIRIGGAAETETWLSDTELSYHVDPETAAHEFGHVIGFRDRYRDIYDFNSRTYKTYQWDIFNLMSGQNVPAPIVTESEFQQILQAYYLTD